VIFLENSNKWSLSPAKRRTLEKKRGQGFKKGKKEVKPQLKSSVF
jgi:hypothetical protein